MDYAPRQQCDPDIAVDDAVACASSGDRPSFHEALEIIADHTAALACEQMATLSAQGRHVSQALYARRDYPVLDVAAMDGYAIARSDCSGTSRRLLAIASPHFAGRTTPAVRPGHALPISTGATVPEGVGAILVRERAVVADGRLAICEALPDGMNIRRAGEDARTGELVLERGRKIHPAVLGALCAYGIDRVSVRRRPVVGLFTSGDELQSLETVGAGGIVDSNGPMLAALLEQAGCVVRVCRSVGDDAATLRATITALLAEPIDMIVSTGGVSVGDRDMLPGVLKAIGATRHFHGVSMRPGKPALFASLPDGRPFFALPGNPAAALTCARFMVMRAVRAMCDLPSEPPLQSASSIEPGVTRLLKAARQRMAGAGLDAVVLPGQQSHRLRPFLSADSWIVSGGGRATALYPLYDSLEAP